MKCKQLMERTHLTTEARSCDSSARVWCLRMCTLSIVVCTFMAMLFYSWGGVLFDDDPYIITYVNGCSHVAINAQRVNDTTWRVENALNVVWIPSPPDASYTWNGTHLTIGCSSVLGIGTT